MAKIIGPGSMIVDITGFTPRFPAPGETVRGNTLRFGPGGKGANQITAAHRAGAKAILIGCIGKDFLAEILKKHYVSEGLADKYIKTSEKVTGSAIVEIDVGSGQNKIIVIAGANESITAKEVYEAESDFATSDAILTQLETTESAVFACKDLAKKYRKPMILNPAPYCKVPESMFCGIDYLTPNETETEQFTGIAVNTLEDCKKASEKFLQMGVKNVIITLGVKGAYFYNGEKEIFIPAIKVKAVETTGAGDAFNGGLATAIAEGMEIEKALQFATCTAAISVSRYGSSASMPNRDEIEALMEKEFGKNNA